MTSKQRRRPTGPTYGWAAPLPSLSHLFGAAVHCVINATTAVQPQIQAGAGPIMCAVCVWFSPCISPQMICG